MRLRCPHDMTLRAERRQQGARMVTQRMQLEEDFVLQLLQEREGRRQAEASLQKAQQELAQLRRHLDRGDGMIDAVRVPAASAVLPPQPPGHVRGAIWNR